MAAVMVAVMIVQLDANLNFTLLKRICDRMNVLLELCVQIRELMAKK